MLMQNLLGLRSLVRGAHTRRIVVSPEWRIGARALFITIVVLPVAAIVWGGGWAAASLVVYTFSWLAENILEHWLSAAATYMIVSLVVAVGWESGHPLYRYSVSLLLSYLLIGSAILMDVGAISR